MNEILKPRGPIHSPSSARLLDVLIRAALLFGMAVLCYRVFAPFLTLTVWAIILAVALYPLQRRLARRLGGRSGIAATFIVCLFALLIIAPTAVLLSSLGDSLHQLIHSVQAGTLQVPAPRDGVRAWPLVGERLHAGWVLAHGDLPAFVQSLQPKIGDIARSAVELVASIGGGILQFLVALILAGVVMAFGESGARGSRAIFERVAGRERGARFTVLATATVRAVAQGVIGIALIQAILIGLCLLLAGIPWAGILSAIVLVLAIAQLPALLVTLPAIAWIWMGGDYQTGPAVLYTVLLLASGAMDNVLKPLMLGRGVDAPMPVVLVGALGGMAAAGILGMFVGATLLALGYQVFMGWVADNPEPPLEESRRDDASATVAATVEPASM
jgi:predicted PurR-regulated permease PerM